MSDDKYWGTPVYGPTLRWFKDDEGDFVVRLEDGEKEP